jgi:hypothetical protein
MFKAGSLRCKDKDNKNYIVDKTDPRYLSKQLVPFSKGTVTVYDKQGNALRVNADDPRYLAGELIACSKGRVVVKDFNDNTLAVKLDDARYLSGELVFIFSGLVDVVYNNKIFKCKPNDPNILNGTYKKLNGKKNKFYDKKTRKAIYLYKEDPKVLNGEVEKISKNLITVKDNNGKCFSIFNDDKRLKKGEVFPVTAKHFINCSIHGKQLIIGQKRKKETQIPEKYKTYCPKCISYYLSK